MLLKLLEDWEGQRTRSKREQKMGKGLISLKKKIKGLLV